MRHPRLHSALVKVAGSDSLSWLETQRLKLKLGLNPFTSIVKKDVPLNLFGEHAYPEEGGGGVVHINKDSSPSVVAHELGHLTHGKNRLELALTRMSNSLAPLAKIAPGLIAAATDPDSDASKYAPVLGGVLAAPKLVSEGLASYRGLKALKEIRPDASILPAVLAQLTYPAYLLGGGVVVPYFIRKTKKEREDR